MKQILVTLISLFALGGVFTLAAKPEVGSAAPGFTLTDTHGVSHSLSDFEGKYVVLEWTNHQCPFVVKHYKEGHMQDLQAKWTDKGVVWLNVVSSAPGKQGYVTAEQANELMEANDFKSTAMLLDPEGTVGKAYDAKTTPHMYVIDPEGTLIYMGAIDSIRSADPDDIAKADNYVVMALEADMAGEEVAAAVTRPYGCSVKY